MNRVPPMLMNIPTSGHFATSFLATWTEGASTPVTMGSKYPRWLQTRSGELTSVPSCSDDWCNEIRMLKIFWRRFRQRWFHATRSRSGRWYLLLMALTSKSAGAVRAKKRSFTIRIARKAAPCKQPLELGVAASFFKKHSVFRIHRHYALICAADKWKEVLKTGARIISLTMLGTLAS